MHPALTSRLQSCGLSFLAAYVDTLGFIALFGLFTAHVTGNFILIGAAMADSSQMSILLKFLAFPAFIAGVAAARLLIAAIQRRQGRAAQSRTVGRIEEGEIAAFARRRRPRGIGPDHLGRRRFAELAEVLADQPDRAGLIVEEGGVRGAARQRLDAERAGAGEGVEHARLDQRRGAVFAPACVHQDVE